MAEDKDTITVKAPTDFKEELREEARLRGHSINEAALEILIDGLPKYKKRHKQKYVPVGQAA